MTCGWPKGTHTEDGFCGQHATVVHLVKVHDIPLDNVDAEARVTALALCAAHGQVPPTAMWDVLYDNGEHNYWSTHCRHAIADDTPERHQACRATELAPGVPRRPAQCKTCGAPCRCPCHTASASPVSPLSH